MGSRRYAPLRYSPRQTIFYYRHKKIYLDVEDGTRVSYLPESAVTGVKGNAESDYRTGDVNLTPANLGAAASDHTHPEYLKKTEYVTAGKKDGTTPGQYATSEGYSTTATGQSSHAEGHTTVASGASSHSEGSSTEASGYSSHAEGFSSEASGPYSHAEGDWCTASGMSSHAEGHFTVASGNYSHASGNGTRALSYQTAVGIYNNPKTAATFGAQGDGTVFVVGSGGPATKGNVFRVQQDGKCFGTGSWNTSGADYAEMFEWVDGNEANEDRRGLFVTLDGEKIRLATSNDDYILGVVSANPSAIGDNGEDWNKRYLQDVFGGKILSEPYLNKDGEEIQSWVQNPDFDPNLEYISRDRRQEWAAVGMLGKLVVVDDGTCEVDGYCYPGANGIGTKAETGYRVMKRIDDTHVTVLIK